MLQAVSSTSSQPIFEDLMLRHTQILTAEGSTRRACSFTHFHVPARKASCWRHSTVPPTYLLSDFLWSSLATSAISSLVRTASPLDCIAFVLFQRHACGEMRYLALDATTAGPSLACKCVSIVSRSSRRTFYTVSRNI